jgi:hypothetical protein
MTDQEFDHAVQTIAFGGQFGGDKLTYYALSNDELAIYLARPRHKSPGVIVLHRNGTWCYDPSIPANDPMVAAKQHL